MTRPRLVSRYFGRGPKDQWPRLAAVLAYTAEQHCPEWDLDIAAFTPERLSSPLGVQGNVDNTVKLDEWCRVIWQAADGDRLLLLDTDTVILRSLDAVWDEPFDVAYTVKPGGRFPLNGGVVFVRVSPASRAFMRAWQTQNRIFLDEPREFDVWRHHYGGLNQTALGVLLRRQGTEGLRALPCAEWNVEDDHWLTHDPAVARILHVKSDLGRMIFGRTTVSRELRPLVQRWRALEVAARRAAREEVPA